VAAGLPLLLEDAGDKPTVHALRELGEGVMSWETLFDLESQEKERLQAQAELS